MAKVTIKGFVHVRPADKYSDAQYALFLCDDMTECGFQLVGPHEFEYEIPAAFDPVASEVQALNKKLDQVSEDYSRKVSQIKGRIAELLCIENEVTA